MARDSKGRFVGGSLVRLEAPPVRLTEATGQRLVRLLEQIAYNTAQTHLTFDEYLRQRVYKETARADHPAAD